MNREKEILKISFLGIIVDVVLAAFKMTVYFDLVIDFKAENKEQIESEVIQRMKERFADYEFIAVLDSDVSD